MNTNKIINDDLKTYILRLGDTALIHGQRLGEWCGHAPSVEEDIALANIALDHIGQSRYLLSLVGDEDQLAFLRDEREFKNITLVELDNQDFAHSILKVCLVAAYQMIAWRYLCTASSFDALAHIAEKAAKEAKYHFEYSAQWLIKLGDGTDISHQKTQNAVNYLMPYVSELFEDDAITKACYAQKIAPLNAQLRDEFDAMIQSVFEKAQLKMPAQTIFRSQGKYGIHSEHLGKILTDMQFVQRSYPNGNW